MRGPVHYFDVPDIVRNMYEASLKTKNRLDTVEANVTAITVILCLSVLAALFYGVFRKFRRPTRRSDNNNNEKLKEVITTVPKHNDVHAATGANPIGRIEEEGSFGEEEILAPQNLPLQQLSAADRKRQTKFLERRTRSAGNELGS